MTLNHSNLLVVRNKTDKFHQLKTNSPNSKKPKVNIQQQQKMVEINVVSVSQTSFRLKIPNISHLNEVYSPIQVVQDIPWKVKVYKSVRGSIQTLGVYLYCAKTDTSPIWSTAASAKFKLLSFEGSNFIEGTTEPYAFNFTESSVGFPSFVGWTELINPANHFIRDDYIQLDVDIEAADPHETNQSILMLGDIHRSCASDCLVKFEISIFNVSNLMAVRSAQFVLRGLLWDFSVYKDHSGQLGVRLGSRMTSDHISCNVRMTTKLIATDKHVLPVEKVETKVVRRLQFLQTDQLIAWNEMLDVGNRFVENDSIRLLIEVISDTPELDVPNKQIGDADGLNDSMDRSRNVRLECPVCMESIAGRDISCTPCGHLFCSECILNAAKNRKTCPSCNHPITLKNLRRIFLPM